MGLRFRKSMRLAPGIRMNFTKSGPSMTFGPRGASIGIGQRGTYLNVGGAGTGLYMRERLGGSGRSSSGRTGSGRSLPVGDTPVTVDIDDDGTVHFLDASGFPLPDNLAGAIKRRQGDKVRRAIQQKCDEINAQIEALGELHLHVPSPLTKPQYEPRVYGQSQPTKPPPTPPPTPPTRTELGLLASLFKSQREKIEKQNTDREKQFADQVADIKKQNADREHQYAEAMSKWNQEKQQFDEAERRRKDMVERGIYADVGIMMSFLEENLQSIVWPRETSVSTEVIDGGRSVYLDVDLPEIEDMPRTTASAPQRGYKLTVKEMSPIQIQRLYMRHVHGIGFRIIGETFAALPNTQEVVLSAYSQRPNSATAQAVEEYLYSVRVDRNTWSRIDFSNLKNLDVVESLAQFDLRHNMTKTGAFKPIEPFAPHSSLSS
jgi:hypothetical protein